MWLLYSCNQELEVTIFSKSTATMSSSELVNFGKSLIVPSVQELAKQSISTVPTRYRLGRTHQHPQLLSNEIDDQQSVPVIDLQGLLSTVKFGNFELEKLHSACQEWGFFQIINHGIPASLLDNLRSEVSEFLKLPLEEKKRLWQRADNHEGFGQLFVVSEEQKLDWSDMFYITTLPNKLRKMELFENLPSKLRESIEAYSMETKKLAMVLLRQLAKALNMDADEMEEAFNDGVQSMRMNYYPPCPEPDAAIGFTPHSDADAITILFQLNQTEGLQIRRHGKWLPIKPLHNALVVNLGDIMEIVSNGLYRSVEHRATVNASAERVSVATFYSCNLESELGPARSLIGPGNPPRFRRIPIDDYFKNFFARKLDGKAYLDFMKVEDQHHDQINAA